MLSRLWNRIGDTFATITNMQSRAATRQFVKNQAAAVNGPGEGSGTAQEDDRCMICLDENISQPRKLKCGHTFCTECITEYFRRCQEKCPTCGRILGAVRGNQPKGTFKKSVINMCLPGYESVKTIQITYSIPNGIQTDAHPHPGVPFFGTTRVAYLPDCPEGREVCELLKLAFDARLIFTVGQSITTGMDNVVVWNDIHHKTQTHGEPYGYPDHTYLQRVKADLAAKGIVLPSSSTGKR